MASSPPLAPQSSNTPPPAITSTPPPDVLQPAEEAPSPQPSFTTPRVLQIGTRASALAIAQVNIFTSILTTLHPNLPTKTVPISVAGDRDKTTDLHTLAQTGKSLWTEELEVLLLKGEIDCIVHSLKDVPTKVVTGCEVKIVGDRGERRDCVVFPTRRSTTTNTTLSTADGSTAYNGDEDGTQSLRAQIDGTPEPSEPSHKKQKTASSSSTPPPHPQKLSDLPPNSMVGTSSIRRSAMIRRRYPHLRIQDVRGNIGTRLRKLDDPAHGYDCIILAATGLQRLGFGERISEWLDPGPDHEEGEGGTEKEGEGKGKGAMLHAVGQGGIGLEIREGDEWMQGLLEGRAGQRGVVVNRVSWECQAERSLLRTLEGGCSVPVGVSCSWETSPSSLSSTPSTTAATATGNENNPTLKDTTTDPPPSQKMSPGTLHIRASVTSVDGTRFVSASRRQWVSNDQEADEAGWEVARVLVDRGAGSILEGINLNRGMVERGDGA
ncbi:MAG: hypothetical protein L6R36_002666 [Xanthoria steineri]|nr:MAG: hypothetical protein L6R36_002666 [Xanthoria steineri]